LTLAKSGQVGDLEQVFMVSEAWMSQAAADQTPFVPPSQDPNRKEVLIVSNVQVKERETRMVIFEMIRDDAGELADLKEFEALRDERADAYSPLLDAFVRGFRIGRRGKLN
jgi:hypothetical protein